MTPNPYQSPREDGDLPPPGTRWWHWLMNCGDERLSRPSMGAWITYGLGSENENLPGFIAMCPGLPVADVSNWRSSFLPGVYQGTHLDTRKTTID